MSLIAMKLKTLRLRFQKAERRMECRRRKPVCCLIGNARGDKALGKAPGEELRITWTSGVSKGGDAEVPNIISFLPDEGTEDKKSFSLSAAFFKKYMFSFSVCFISVFGFILVGLVPRKSKEFTDFEAKLEKLNQDSQCSSKACKSAFSHKYCTVFGK